MKITIEGLSDRITEPKQQELSQAVLIALAHHNVEINGVTVTFETAEF